MGAAIYAGAGGTGGLSLGPKEDPGYSPNSQTLHFEGGLGGPITPFGGPVESGSLDIDPFSDVQISSSAVDNAVGLRPVGWGAAAYIAAGPNYGGTLLSVSLRDWMDTFRNQPTHDTNTGPIVPLDRFEVVASRTGAAKEIPTNRSIPKPSIPTPKSDYGQHLQDVANELALQTLYAFGIASYVEGATRVTLPNPAR